MIKRRELIVGMAAMRSGILITKESEAAFPLVINLARILLTGLRTTGAVSCASSAFSTGQLRASRVLPAATALPVSVPESSSLILLALGLMGLIVRRLAKN